MLTLRRIPFATEMRHRLRDGLFITQLVLGSNLLHFSVQLALPIDTFATNKGYAWFERFGEQHSAFGLSPEDTWSFIFGMGYLAILPGMLCQIWPHFLPKPRVWQMGGAFSSAVMHGLVAFGFFVSAPTGTGWGTYAIFCALSYWVLWMALDHAT